jgi:hypothetical protein
MSRNQLWGFIIPCDNILKIEKDLERAILCLNEKDHVLFEIPNIDHCFLFQTMQDDL